MNKNFLSGLIIPAALIALGVVFSVGCDDKTTVQGGPGEGIHVEAPGTKVDVGGSQGIQVETPKASINLEAPKKDAGQGENSHG